MINTITCPVCREELEKNFIKMFNHMDKDDLHKDHLRKTETKILLNELKPN